MTFRLMVLRFVGLFFRFILSVLLSIDSVFLCIAKKEENCCYYGSGVLVLSVQIIANTHNNTLFNSQIMEMNTYFEFTSHLKIRVFGLWTQLHNPKLKRAKAKQFPKLLSIEEKGIRLCLLLATPFGILNYY